jgi:RNA polymerase subunit RPABC4/transcription elongation factor Spt4
LVKINEVLEPGEQLIMESSGGPFTQVTYVKSLVSNVQGRLFLTSNRLIFLPGNFQNTDSTILVLGKLIKSPDSVHIPLSSITKVEKGWGEQIAIYADKKHDFRGMRGAGDWATAIEKARASPAPRQPEAAPRAYSPPPQASQGGGQKFCNNCGKPLRPQDKFCPNCGSSGSGGANACPSCGGTIEPGQKFCNSCGAKL